MISLISSKELFSRRRWTNGLAQKLNVYGIATCIRWISIGGHVINSVAYHLGRNSLHLLILKRSMSHLSILYLLSLHKIFAWHEFKFNGVHSMINKNILQKNFKNSAFNMFLKLCKKSFFVGWPISRCLSTTPHTIGGQQGTILLVHYYMIILKPAIFEYMAVVRYDHTPFYNSPSRVRIKQSCRNCKMISTYDEISLNLQSSYSGYFRFRANQIPQN